MADEMNGEREALGLSLEKRGGVWVVQFAEGGCRPASIVEVDLWQALQAGRASLAANAGGEPVAEVECDCAAQDMPFGTCCKVRKAFEQWYDAQPDGRVQPFDVWRAAWGRRFPHTSPPEGMAGWQDIATAPRDGTRFLAAALINCSDGTSWWERHSIYVDDESGTVFYDGGDDTGWELTDYWVWMPLPPAPPLPASEAGEA